MLGYKNKFHIWPYLHLFLSCNSRHGKSVMELTRCKDTVFRERQEQKSEKPPQITTFLNNFHAHTAGTSRKLMDDNDLIVDHLLFPHQHDVLNVGDDAGETETHQQGEGCCSDEARIC